jgi:beta-phosphoglucomutase
VTAPFAGAIFDVDGVLLDSPHERAWREALDGLMHGEWEGPATGWRPGAFTPQVYQSLVSGRPRASGARAVLEHFGVPDAAQRAQLLGEHKQARLLELITAGELHAYPDALRFVDAVREAGIPVAVASSSANAPLLLASIGLAVDRDVSGRVAGPGKPDPAIFLAAAAALDVPPERCFVVEDAVAGIRAARAAGVAALGVARAHDADALAETGAGLVVRSLDDVDLAGLAEGRLAARTAAGRSA